MKLRKAKNCLLQLDVLRESERKVIASCEDLVKVLSPIVAELEQEIVLCCCLNTRGRMTTAVIIGIGTLDASIVHPRDVFREAIRNNARSIILVHTHPSGEVQPSIEDQILTERLRSAGELLGIPLVDHVIISTNGYYSFAVLGEV